MAKLSYDLHLHSCLSPCADDDMTPGNIAGLAALLGLDIIALTDHNSCKNCLPFLAAAKTAGITAIPGMELTTSEEVHVLCYFESLSAAMDFDNYVEQRILPIPNHPSIFGNQFICDKEDKVCSDFPTLLISATSISFFELSCLLPQYNGIMVPAHLDKQSNSLLGNLGFVPDGSTFSCCEFHNLKNAAALSQQHPYLSSCHQLCSSDAHQLTSLHEKQYFLEACENTLLHILKILGKKPVTLTATQTD